MPNDSTLSIILRLEDEASAKLREIAGRVERFSKRAGHAFSTLADRTRKFGASIKSFGDRTRNAGMGISIGLTAPIIMLGKKMIDTSLKFSTAMELIRTQSGATQKEVDRMTKSIIKFGESGTTGQGPVKLADALKHLESLSMRGKKAMDALKVSAMAADISGTNIEDIATALGGAIVTKIKGVKDYAKTMGALDAIIGQGNMQMQDLTSAMGTGFLSTAKTFGLSLRSVGAALATMTDNGMPAVRSATRLRMAITLMGAPLKPAIKLMKQLGITQYELANKMRSGGLISALSDIKGKLDASGFSITKQTAIISNMFGGGRTGAGIMLLLNELPRVKAKYEAIGKQADLFQAKWDAWAKTPQGRINLSLAQMKSLMTDMASTVLPTLTRALGYAVKLVKRFADYWHTLSPATRGLVVKLVGLVAILGPALLILGSIATAIGTLVGFAGGIIKVVAFVVKLGGSLGELAGVGELVATAFTGIVAFFTGALFVVAVSAVVFQIYRVIHAWGTLSDSMNSIKKSNDIARGALNSPAMKKYLDNATPLQRKHQLRQNLLLTKSIASNVAIKKRYSGFGGHVNAVIDEIGGYIHPSSKSNGMYVKARQSALPTYNFNFHGPTVGDQGIKDLIKGSISTINRQTQLQTYAGTRS